MDGAVRDAYEWTDVPTECESLPDRDLDDDASLTKGRYRCWQPNRVPDEVLTRLLKLTPNDRGGTRFMTGSGLDGRRQRLPVPDSGLPDPRNFDDEPSPLREAARFPTLPFARQSHE